MVWGKRGSESVCGQNRISTVMDLLGLALLQQRYIAVLEPSLSKSGCDFIWNPESLQRDQR